MNNEQLRICTYNIHKGFSTSNRKYLLNDIRSAIRGINADMVFLQEVMGESHRKRSRHTPNQFEFLADSIWQHQAYGKNAIYQRGHHGNAILSKYPFEEHKNINISQYRFSQRGLLLGKTTNGIYLLCAHFGLFEHERQSQFNAMIKLLIAEVPAYAPLIIAGDFNDWNLHLHQQLLQHTHLQEAHTVFHHQPARTFPSKWPILPMDRIYFRHLQLVETQVLSGKPWSALSDHCALSATFQLPDTAI